MPRHAAFLRGVNLGSRRRVSSDRLRACFEGLGFDAVATFRTSGNVVFDCPRESRERLTARIERGLADDLGFDVDVFVRTAAEMQALAAARPFAPEAVEAAQGKLQVVMLRERPSAAAAREVLALAGADDHLELGERELFWLPSGGIRDSKLDWKAAEQTLGSTTTRTKGTVELLAEKHFEHPSASR